MIKKSVIYFDLETQRTATDIGGWDHLGKMGVSVAVALSSNGLHVFTAKTIKNIGSLLESARTVIGYNILNFDFKVLAGYRGVDLTKVNAYDMMTEVSKAVGRQLTLDALAKATLGTTRDIDGLAMVKLWKQGRIENVVEGCCNDVLTMKALHEYGCDHGEVFYYPQAGSQRKAVTVDWER